MLSFLRTIALTDDLNFGKWRESSCYIKIVGFLQDDTARSRQCGNGIEMVKIGFIRRSKDHRHLVVRWPFAGKKYN